MERKTRQREALLETFRISSGPLTPLELLEQTKAMVPDLGIATVYRNIKNFIEAGVLTAVPVPGQPDRYELSGKKHHHHCFCRICHRAFEAEGCPGSMNSLAPQGFKVEGHEIFLYGICKDCQKQS